MLVHEQALKIMNDAGQLGIRVDVDGLEEWAQKNLTVLRDLQYKIQNLTGIEKPGSSKEVGKWLDGLGVSGRGSSKDRLQLVTGKGKGGPVEASELIPQWRTLRKSVSSAQNLLSVAVLDGEHRLHYEWGLSEKTNRLYSGVQNLSVDIRDFLLPEEGHTVVVLDYQSQELRVLLHETGETELLKSLDAGEDFHEKMAGLVFLAGDEITEQQRDRAKAITYGIPYGQRAEGLAYRWGISKAEAQLVVDKYNEIRPNLSIWIELQMAYWQHSGGRVQTVSGHVREDCPEESVINTIIQGSAADAFCAAIIRVLKVCAKTGARIMVGVHDSLVLSVPKGIGFQAFAWAMEKTPEYGHMPINVKTGVTWGEAHRAKGDKGDALEGHKVGREKNGETKEFAVWSEGYATTGLGGGANFHGKILAKSFKDACVKVFRGDKLFDPESLTYWGCKLFDNEADARKSFG